MACGKKVVLTALLGSALILFVMPENSHAGWLRDWLNRCATRRAERTAYDRSQRYPDGAGYVPQTAFDPATFDPATVGYYPETANYPGTANCGQTCYQPCAQSCQRTTVQYMPQVAYRTTYHPVPVTLYRPTTRYNAWSGCTKTCLRPCTTYQWQARRVPYTTFRPVYTTITVGSPITGSYPPQPGYTGCNQGLMTTPSPTPQTMPSLIPSASPSLAPPSLAPVNPTPADTTPRLNPGEVGDGAAQTQRITPQFVPNSSAPPSGRANSSSNLKPIPDLDRGQSDGFRNSAPKLLNPRDRTAAYPIRPAVHTSPIQWAGSEWNDSGWRAARD